MWLINPKAAIVNETTTVVFTKEDAKWKQFFEITNDWIYKIYLAFGADAEVWKWTPLNVWDRYYLDYTDNIDRYFMNEGCNAIADWGVGVLSIQEFDYSNW